MNMQEYLETIKDIHKYFIEYIEKDDNYQKEEDLLIQLITDKKIEENKFILEEILETISQIATYHYQVNNFYEKIQSIILLFKESIKKNIPNPIIYNIFEDNKQILLFLMNQGILTTDSSTSINLKNNKNDNLQEKDSKLKQNKKINCDNDIICTFIENDSIDEFTSYFKQNNLSNLSMIQSTFYETDPFLLNKKSTLIEYSAFCGSTRIFKFLYQQEVDFTPSLFHYSIHSNNLEIFQMLEKYLVNQTDKFLNELLIESIKCHHNQITNYIFTKFSSNHNFDRNEVKISIFKYHNYSFLPTNFDDPFIFYLACLYNYVTIVENLLKTTTKTNLNKLIELPNKNKQTALHGAIDKNNFEIVNLLIQQDEIDVNSIMYTSKDKTAKTSLCFAIEKGDERIIKLLLSNKNIDINQESVIENNYFYKKEINQKSPLFLAVEKENEEIVRLLLEHEDLEINSKSVLMFEKAQSKYKSTEEKTPLYLAVETENIKIIKLLLSNDKIDINSKYVFQESASSQYYFENAPIHIAVQNSNKEIIQLLLACETIDVNSLSISSYKNIEVEFLFEKSALKKALQNQDSEIVQLLLSHSKIDVNMNLSKTMKKRNYEFNESSSVLYRQVAKNHFEMVKILLTHPKIDVNLQATQKHERMALNYYLYQLPSDRVSPKFKDYIVKDDDRFYNPQFLEKAVLISMNKNFTPNFMSLKVKENNSVPPLARAIFERNIDIIKLLLNHPDIDVNIIIKDSVKIQKEFTFNYFPLYLAVLTKKEEIVSLLLNHSKIDVNKVKESKLYFNDKITLINKSNSLHLSVENGQQNIVQLFFQHPDTDINAKLITFDIHIEEGTNIISNIEKNRLSLLGITLMTKNLKMASFLLSQKNIDVNEKYIYTYEILVKGKKLRLMEAYNGTVLYYAIEKKNIDFVKLLLSKKEVDVNILSMSKGFNRSDNKKAISSLLRLTPLHAAIKNKSPEIMNLLLSRPDINANSTIYVKKYDNCTMGGYIEYKGFKSNDLAHFYNVYKETPIQMAIKCGNLEILSLLLARKEININQKTIYKRQIEGVDDEFEKKEMTALITVIEADSTEMIELLLRREDIDVNIITKNKTVFKYIKKGREGVMYLFDERTALHHAIINNKMMMIARLIENKKINTNIKYVYRISKNGIEDVDSGEWTNADLINNQEDELFKMIMSPILELFKKDEEPINMINKANEEEDVENKDIKEEEEEEDFKDELKEEDLFDIDDEEEENPFKATKLNSNQLLSLLTSVLHSHQNEEEDNNNNNNVEEEARSIVNMAKSVDKINGNQEEDCLIS